MLRLLRGAAFGLAFLVFVGLALGGGTVVSQWVYGYIRPAIPEPIRALIGSQLMSISGEGETAAQEYLKSVPKAMNGFMDDLKACQVSGENVDYPCSAKAVEVFRDRFGPTVPFGAAWMNDAHDEFYIAINGLHDIYIRSMAERHTLELARDAVAAEEAIDSAAIQWFEVASR